MLSEDMAEAANQECPILDKVYEDQTVVGISGKKVEFDTVKFVRCRMEECDFSGASFCNVVFDFSKSRNKRTIFKQYDKDRCSIFVLRFLFEPLVGFEPTTPRLQITCSGQLS